MKILHIVPSYKPAYLYGGPIKSVHDLNSGLAKAGVDISVVTTSINGKEDMNVPLGEEVDLDGVKVYYFKGGRPRSWFYSSNMVAWLKKNVSRFDLIHITSVFLFQSFIGAHYAKKFKKPYIISPRGSLMFEPLKKSALKKKMYLWAIEKNNLASAAAIHFTAQEEEKEYLAGRFPIKKGIVLPNGLNYRELDISASGEEFKKKYGIDSDKKIILFLSRISWKKGFDTLIPAFGNVLKEHSNAVLVVAGGDDEGYKKEVLKMADSEGVADKIIYTGMLLGSDKVSALKAASVFVLPSYSENFGNVILEAMHLGVPAVITDKIAIADEIAKESAGLVVKKDISSLSAALLKILENSEVAASLAVNGRKFCEKFDADLIANKWVQEYNSIIKRK